MPFVFLWLGVIGNENPDILRSIGRCWRLGDRTLAKTFGCYYVFLISGAVFLLIIYSPLIYLNLEFLNWNFKLSEEMQYILSDYFPRLLVYTGLLILFGLMQIAYLILFYSLREITEANELMGRIQSVKTHYGSPRQ